MKVLKVNSVTNYFIYTLITKVIQLSGCLKSFHRSISWKKKKKKKKIYSNLLTLLNNVVACYEVSKTLLPNE